MLELTLSPIPRTSAPLSDLIARNPLDSEPHILPETSWLFRVYLVGDVAYAFGQAANEIFDGWLPSGTYWYEPSPTRPRIAFHAVDVVLVSRLAIGKGYRVELRGA